MTTSCPLQQIFQLADGVVWKSKGKSKFGKIVAVLKDGANLDSLDPEWLSKYKLMTSIRAPRRRGLSYLVRVESDKMDTKPQLYWPRTCGLEKVQSDMFEGQVEP
jgi:hypothetical protein